MRAYVRLWRELMALCWSRKPFLTALVMMFLALASLMFPVIGLALRAVVNGSVSHDTGQMAAGSLIAALSYAAAQISTAVGFNLRIQLVEQVGLTEIDTRILRAITGIDEIDHLERSDYLDRVTVVRGQAWGIVDSAWAVMESASNAIRLSLTLAVLAAVNPSLLAMLIFAVIPLLLERRGHALIRQAEIESADAMRLQRHLFSLGTNPASGKEIRVAGVAGELSHRQAQSWDEMTRIRFRAELIAAVWSVAAWSLFTAGFVAGLALVVWQTSHGHGSVGDIVLAVTVGAQLRAAVTTTVQRSGDASRYQRILAPYQWLRENYKARAETARGTRMPPAVLRDGITIEHLTFSYPGATRPAIDDLSVHLPAGSVVAIVGEYGSGKTTLVKLLAKFYRPQSGTIRVDGTDLQDVHTRQWRRRMTAAFQEFGRYQAQLREAIGVGSLPHIGDAARLQQAVHAAAADTLLARLPRGLDTQLGKQFGGIELSEGQWQKVALARASMRSAPLLFILDEPTASLDPPSEQVIFDRYMARSRAVAAAAGTITIVISHRFSTVADADYILVMASGRLAEHGDHAALLRLGGIYADLYGIHATAYSG